MNILELDLKILETINQPFSTALNLFFICVVYSVYVYLIYLMYYFYKQKQIDKLLHLFITSIVSIAFVNMLKYGINRPRPYESHEEIKSLIKKADPSFPSAHATMSTLSLKFIPNFPKIYRGLISFYLSVLIPIGSLYIGIHYPSDVLVGAAIGFLVPRIISENFAKKLSKRFFK